MVGIIEAKCPRCKRIVYLQEFTSYTAERQSFMVTINTDGLILTVSHGIKDSLGYEVSEAVGSSIMEYIDPSIHEATIFWVEGLNQKGRDEGSYTSLIVPLISKGGEEKIFSLLIRPTCLNGKRAYLAVAEAGLDSAKLHDKKVISRLARDGRSQREGWDFIIDKEGLITEVSGVSRTGYLKEDLLGRSLLDIIESDTKEVLESLNKTESFVLSLNLKTKLSKSGKYLVCFAPDFLADPESPAFIVALRPQEAPLSASTSQTSAA